MEHRITLNGTWNWCDMESKEWHKGTVPGTVLTDMMDGGLIEDPYWRTNEYETRELSRRDYRYEREFEVPESFFREEEQCLVFEGLDTIADIYLNDELLLAVNDMHRTWRIDVKGKLKAVNRLAVAFHSPTAFIEKADREGDIFYASTGCMKGNGALRKAHYMFGWDWGPQLPDAGIFRNVYLSGFSTARLDDVRIRQEHGAGGVKLSVESSVRKLSESDTAGSGTLACKITAPDGTVISVEKELCINDTIEALIEAPQLWWPNGYGAQPLYAVRVELRTSDSILDVWERTIGLRTVTVCTDADEWGNQFAFVVNGQKIFAMGANYIPEDNLLGHLSEERSERLIRDCARANFNCIRIWGGGYYPEDYVYDACDRYGILVWQDLMFACNVYNLNDEFEANILAETADNVKRIRHHACLGLWCGNNEMEWGWRDWGRLEGHRPKYKADYTKIFEMLLPRLVKQVDGQTYYWLSSPSSGGSFDDPNDFNRGDNHYWEVWHSNKPFTEYRDFYFRFCSEFGFQSFPGKKTLDSFSLPEDQNIFSEVMESHQKNGLANTKIFSYISGYYKYPKDMESIAYISQILQLKAIQYGVEHWRRNWGRCMGSIYWQLNDCWPVASWASIDYYGRWKALHYGAKRFYARFMATACEKEELSTEIDYYIHNESFEERKAVLRVRLIDRDFHTLYETETEITAAAFEVKNVLPMDFAPFLAEAGLKKRAVAEYSLIEDGCAVSRGTTLFVKPKYFDFKTPEYRISVTEKADVFCIHADADTYVSYAELSLDGYDVVLEDNFFDITSEEGVDINVDKKEFPNQVTAEEVAAALHIRSVADSF
ncbi:glycoside hydrolase family 2 protein [Hungatella sp. L12]|uniref:Beta-mannosidase B n=1 Tax=Hungatella hominis TaxID=2763050 RepID=A0ABR7H3G3_9FIRM|nr:glycoside hydrolase family 2 protein [Hungatella hominis]MBC5707696.1 glycoside hydrolase family 2 protein [Hungatella hominis]